MTIPEKVMNLEVFRNQLALLRNKLDESNQEVRKINAVIDRMELKDSELDRIAEIEKRAKKLIPVWNEMIVTISLLLITVKKFPKNYEITINGKKTRTDLITTTLQRRSQKITSEIESVSSLR